MKRTIDPDMIEALQERIHRIEGSRRQSAVGIATGFDALDQLLAGPGLKRGTLTEWLGEGEGSGAASLALRVAAHILRREGAFVVIDLEGEFYPVAAAQAGIPLERTVIVRPDSPMAALWSWEQSLCCPGVAVTFGWIDSLDDRLFRRLQLAAETGGGLGFLLRRPDCRSGPSWAAARIMFPKRDADRETRNESTDPRERHLQLMLARGRTNAREAGILLNTG